MLVHANFTHLLSNMAVFVVLAVGLEHEYGPLRIGIIFVVSGERGGGSAGQ